MCLAKENESKNDTRETLPKERIGFLKSIYYYFSEFSNNTGIHGFKYLVERERCFIERWCFHTVHTK
jgi:hypothetical protein